MKARAYKQPMSQSEYSFDTSHSHVAFTVRHMVFSKVRGEFTKWSGTAKLDEGDLAKSSIDASIEVGSIDTHEEKRDAHLKSADFFDADNHKQITFKGTAVEAKGKGKLALTGDLTIRGVTKPVTLDVEELGRGKDPWGNERVGFSAKTSINRNDFGLKWNQVLEAGGVLVGEKVDIEIDVELTKKA
jgi:polyisoprenoid-binding protein YceI